MQVKDENIQYNKAVQGISADLNCQQTECTVHLNDAYIYVGCRLQPSITSTTSSSKLWSPVVD